MKKLLMWADQYIRESDWKTLALLKLCLCSIGIIIGLAIPKEKKKFPLIIAAIVFMVTYVPLMVKFSRIAATKRATK